MRLQYLLFSICIVLLFQLPSDSICSNQINVITRWANQLGKELWDLGTIITKRYDIENSYIMAELETKDPQKIILEIVGNVSYMMKKKMDAVNCIIEAAEHLAEDFNISGIDHNYTYYRSNPPVYEDEDPDAEMYIDMVLDNDTHFFNLRVNTTHSSVHIPTNVYHKHAEAEIAIRWSETLDETFAQNYKADPALSWQYFGSSAGIMRHYPAMSWSNLDPGLFDCRIRTWFIEAATCTKDVVILLDNSGSMAGWNKHLAFLTVQTVLQTLSNNDYVNIMIYSERVDYLISCFEDQLVQATEENIVVFQEALQTLNSENKSFVDLAMTKAFELLYKYRDIRNCYQNKHFCNQAIMLVSDGISTNLSETINTYNRLHNSTSIPIRIFTYLVGKEPSHIDESIWMACTNRGYHTHVNSLDQVTSAVYKYILVLARPLVLQREAHPLSWTHAYYDDTFDLGNKSSRRFEKYRLLTSVAGPAFNLTAYNNTERRTAELLGVAASDVPTDDIAKLMYQYKTGVNSHSFIVSNNGYVLKHPGLRPVYFNEYEEKHHLKDNYNSIDLTEVEQLDDNSGPREIGSLLEDLRTALVNGELGVIHDIKIKYHYDDMRRVSREINDYYFAPITDTPFSIGFAIPDSYGNYSIEVGDEIKKHRYSPTNISTFFSGSNWKIHPSWAYCKYHYLEGHEFDTPEQEVVHFINRMNTENFVWSMQYEEFEGEHKEAAKCGAQTLGDHDYYCDRNLVQRLVFDAKHTKPAFDELWIARNIEEDSLRLLYDATLRFVATLSGFTRWEYISEPPSDDTSTFGDSHPRAIDETWYKSAVIQHRYNNNSFVYSVPFDKKEDEKILVTGSFAIFPKKGDLEAPGAVVGFQFSHAHLLDRFFKITSASYICRECLLCGSNLECYVIDSSGYIVISKDVSHTGKFFGDIEGVTMEAMIYHDIFEKLTIRDYQAMCFYHKWVKGSSNTLLKPFQYVTWFIKWTLSQFLWLIIEMDLHKLWNPSSIVINAEEELIVTTNKPKGCRKNCNVKEEAWHNKNKIPVYEQIPTACETEHDLYLLRQEVFIDEAFRELLSKEITLPDCVRPFYLKMIPHSNLLLVAIKTIEEETCYFVHTTAKRNIVYNNTDTEFPCQKLYLNNLIRRPLQGCFNEHDLEQEIVDCGRSGRIELYLNLLILSLIIFIFRTFT